jgi:2-oxoisovalerate dehydrogenase E1 component
MKKAYETYRLMIRSRYLDIQEAELHKQGLIDFCVSSAGCEAIAAFPPFRDNDLLFLHYRDRPLMLMQGWKPEELLASAMGLGFSPAGGRNLHPLLVSSARRTFNISGPLGQAPLQAVGAALALKSKSNNSIALASMGDGTTQEGQVLEAFAEASREAAPVLFLIHDNRWAISYPTTGKTFWSLPDGSLLDQYWGIPITYIDGADPAACGGSLEEAVATVRSTQKPGIAVLASARIGEHSSADRQDTYRDTEELADERMTRDPVRNMRGFLLDSEYSEHDLLLLEKTVKTEIENALTIAKGMSCPAPGLESSPAACKKWNQPEHAPFADAGFTMAQALNATLARHLQCDASVSLHGQDIEDPKGDILGLTKGLSSWFPGRVKNAPLAEATIVGGAIGRALVGEKPVVFIQFADFLPHAWSQLACDAASYWWRSGGDTTCPLIVLAPCGGYRHGLGPFHSHSPEGSLAHIPGLHVFVPSNAPDAAGLLNAAFCSGTPTVLLYPNNLLHAASHYAPPDVSELFVQPGQARQVRKGNDLTIVSWGNTVPLCEEAADLLETAGVQCDLLDLRTISPWDRAAVLDSALRTEKLIVVHEDTITGGFGAEVIAWAATHAPGVICRRVARPDVLLPANISNQLALLPSVRSILQSAAELLNLDIHWPDRGDDPDDTIAVPGHNPADEEILVGKLFVSVGDTVVEGQTLAELEGQKALYDFNSPRSGRVIELFVKDGDVARTGSPFLRFASESHSVASSAARPEISKKSEKRQNVSAPTGANNKSVLQATPAATGEARRSAGIVGTGAYLPEQVLSNEELAERFAITTDWIHDRTGIINRRIAAPGQACSDLAIEAAKRAMADAGAAPEEIGMVIVATSTADHLTPATAAIVQNALDIPSAACFDLSAACSGFVYGLMMACNSVTCGFTGKVLLIGAETLSRVVNPLDRDSAILFGDGAGAVVIGSVPDGYGLLATDAGTIGADHASVMLPAGGSRLSASAATVSEQLHYIRIDGNRVFMFAMKALGDSFLRVIENGGFSLPDINLFIPHQANRRIIEAAARRLDLPMDRIVIDLEQSGNTSAATIPIALHGALAAGRIHHGDRLVLTGFGGGVSWGSVLLRWHSAGSDQIHKKGDGQ